MSWTCTCGTVLSDHAFECEFCNYMSAWFEEEHPLYDSEKKKNTESNNNKDREKGL